MMYVRCPLSAVAAQGRGAAVRTRYRYLSRDGTAVVERAVDHDAELLESFVTRSATRLRLFSSSEADREIKTVTLNLCQGPLFHPDTAPGEGGCRDSQEDHEMPRPGVGHRHRPAAVIRRGAEGDRGLGAAGNLSLD